MNSMLNQILRLVYFISSIVGFLCYALSSSFNNLFGNWNFLKISLYTVFSFIVSFTILFNNIWQNSNSSLRLRDHLVFLVFTITTVYSFFFDKANGKPDVYSLVSDAAFAIMSLGFEVDLLYFFCGNLTLHFMKMKLFLVIAGASFSYLLVILRINLKEYSENVRLQQDYLALVNQINLPSQHENNSGNHNVIQIDALVQMIHRIKESKNTADNSGNHKVIQIDALIQMIHRIKESKNTVDNSENVDLGLQQDSLALVNQINLPSQHALQKFMIQDEDTLDSEVWSKSIASVHWRILKSCLADNIMDNLVCLVLNKIQGEQLNERLDALEKIDDGKDDYQRIRLLEYKKYL